MNIQGIYISDWCRSRLIERGDCYEVVSRRAYKFRVGSTYKVYGADEDSDCGANEELCVEVLSSEVLSPCEVSLDVEDVAKYIDSRCGVGTFKLNNRVYLLRLRMASPRLNGENPIRRAWVRNEARIGAFFNKGVELYVGEEIAASEPYCELCDRLGDGYRNLLAEIYGVEKDKIYTITGWTNRRYVKSELMPRRVRILDSKVVNVLDISEYEWALLGVGESEYERMKFVGKYAWMSNGVVRLYKYETIKDYSDEWRTR